MQSYPATCITLLSDGGQQISDNVPGSCSLETDSNEVRLFFLGHLICPLHFPCVLSCTILNRKQIMNKCEKLLQCMCVKWLHQAFNGESSEVYGK